jgi:hypothetical protein
LLINGSLNGLEFRVLSLPPILCSGLWVSRWLLQSFRAVFDSQTEYQTTCGYAYGLRRRPSKPCRAGFDSPYPLQTSVQWQSGECVGLQSPYYTPWVRVPPAPPITVRTQVWLRGHSDTVLGATARVGSNPTVPTSLCAASRD